MKKCPNCQSEIFENFEICWNCNYSLTEQKEVDFKDPEHGRDIDCLRCKVPMIFTGKFKFHEGPNTGMLGNIFELFQNKEEFELYLCSKCGKVEFFTPISGIDKNISTDKT